MYLHVMHHTIAVLRYIIILALSGEKFGATLVWISYFLTDLLVQSSKGTVYCLLLSCNLQVGQLKLKCLSKSEFQLGIKTTQAFKSNMAALCMTSCDN